jgi:NAD-specific glutamate dehydrogenase
LYVEVSQRFGLAWLTYTASVSAYATDWERRAADALIDEAYDRAAELVSRIAVLGTTKSAITRFAAKHEREVVRLNATLTEAMGMPSVALPLLSLVASEIRRLLLAARG